MNELIYSSAVLTLSQTTEFLRNRSLDNIIIHLIVQKHFTDFSIKDIYDSIHSELPIRIEEIEKSIDRSLKTGIVQIKSGKRDQLKWARFQISKAVYDRLEAQCIQLKEFVKAATEELFEGIIKGHNSQDFISMLLEVVTNLMAKYGYAYAGQLAGINEATDFVPAKELIDICESVLKKYKLPLTPKELSKAIGFLFDRRDPCLNNLAFSICNRYYQSRLIGLDLPLDFLTENIYKDSTIFLDTNFIMNIAFSKSEGHNEFREILKNASMLGIKFAASELTIAEIHARVQVYMADLESGEEIIPEELLQEVREDIIQQSHTNAEKGEFNVAESENTHRLKEMGVEIFGYQNGDSLYDTNELEIVTEELRTCDRKYRSQYPAKDNRALFHDAYHYFLVKSERTKKESTSAWFLTMDHSVIEHASVKKSEDGPPYAIRLISLLQTLSQFVESQAMKGEFADLFGDLIAKDLLPQDQLFNLGDLKLLIGFDIKGKSIPPEFLRKATFHIKKNILKGGGITEDNRAEVIHEFTKFLSTPDQNFIELQRKYDKKMSDRDEDIKIKEQKINEFQDIIQNQEKQIQNLIQGYEKLEMNQKQSMLDNALLAFNRAMESSIGEQWNEHFRKSRKIRNRYIIFLFIALSAFTIIFFGESIASWFNKSLSIRKGWRYLIALIVFITPFVRSFFEHKKVIHSFRLGSSHYKENAKLKYIDEAKKEFIACNKIPELNDF